MAQSRIRPHGLYMGDRSLSTHFERIELGLLSRGWWRRPGRTGTARPPAAELPEPLRDSVVIDLIRRRARPELELIALEAEEATYFPVGAEYRFNLRPWVRNRGNAAALNWAVELCVPRCLRETLGGAEIDGPEGNWTPGRCDDPGSCSFIIQGAAVLFPSQERNPGYVGIVVHKGNARALRERQPLMGWQILAESGQSAAGTLALLDLLGLVRAVRDILEL